MLEQLLSGLKDKALGAINDNPEIPNNKLDSIMDIVGKIRLFPFDGDGVNPNWGTMDGPDDWSSNVWGTAIADFDNDGDLDVVFGENNGVNNRLIM